MIAFRNVSLIYPNSLRTVFDSLTLEVNEGELVLVIGHTGVGKSSLIKLINGLVPHHTGGILTGEILVAGRSTRTLRPGQLADVVGIVGQNPSNGFVTDLVEDEIAFSLEAQGVPPAVIRKRVEEVLDLLALTPLRQRFLSSLSGGEQQRVAIGAALALSPKVLLLDEPTSALDPIAAEEVLSIIHRLVHDLGLTVIIAEHRLERVIQFADRILIINADGGVEIGEPTKILAKSPIAPPLVNLSRVMNLDQISLSVRDLRKESEKLRSVLAKLSPPDNVRVVGHPVLEVSNLTVVYGSKANTKVALRDLSLSIKTGEVVALMGRNGSGKSTLLRTAVGLSPIKNGWVKTCGLDPTTLKGRALISRVGYVPQEPGDLLYCQTVLAECEAADQSNELPIGTTYALFESLLAIPSSSVHPRDLSEGQRLGLVISIVLSARPNLLILDEPTRGLDYEAKRELIRIIKDLAYSTESPRGIFIATHDVELVAEIADSVIFLADGEIVAEGSTREILTASPAFAPQVSKTLHPQTWLTVSEVASALAEINA